MSRALAETMPAVAVPPRPKGLPMAMTQSPTRGWAVSSKLTYLKSLPSTLITARSVPASRPIRRAGSSRPSDILTLISVASATTWLLVTMKPSCEMKKPEPAPWVVCGSSPP